VQPVACITDQIGGMAQLSQAIETTVPIPQAMAVGSACQTALCYIFSLTGLYWPFSFAAFGIAFCLDIAFCLCVLAADDSLMFVSRQTAYVTIASLYKRSFGSLSGKYSESYSVVFGFWKLPNAMMSEWKTPPYSGNEPLYWVSCIVHSAYHEISYLLTA